MECQMQHRVRIHKKDFSYTASTHPTFTKGEILPLPSSFRGGGECRPHKGNKYRAKSGIFRIKSQG